MLICRSLIEPAMNVRGEVGSLKAPLLFLFISHSTSLLCIYLLPSLIKLKEGFGARNSLQIEELVQLQHVLLWSYPTTVSFQKGQEQQQQQQQREKKLANLNTVISIILGGGASTHLDPLTFHRATPAVRSTTLLLRALFSFSSFSGAN